MRLHNILLKIINVFFSLHKHTYLMEIDKIVFSTRILHRVLYILAYISRSKNLGYSSDRFDELKSNVATLIASIHECQDLSGQTMEEIIGSEASCPYTCRIVLGRGSMAFSRPWFLSVCNDFAWLCVALRGFAMVLIQQVGGFTPRESLTQW